MYRNGWGELYLIAYFIKSLSARGLPYWMHQGGAAILHGPAENVFPTKLATLGSNAAAKLRSTCFTIITGYGCNVILSDNTRKVLNTISTMAITQKSLRLLSTDWSHEDYWSVTLFSHNCHLCHCSWFSSNVIVILDIGLRIPDAVGW